MIISHKHKFIFIKPMKVAGTSIEVALAKFCGKEDIITRISPYERHLDATPYEQEGQNYQKFYNHMAPDDIQKIVGPEVWDEYLKFTIIRNPWDFLVSFYFWKKRSKPLKTRLRNIATRFKNLANAQYIIFAARNIPRATKRWLEQQRLPKNYDFKFFINNLAAKSANTKYYLNEKGEKILDFYIRYENLEDDYKHICEKLNIPYEPLPKLKTKVRTDKKHYSEYYDEYLEKLVEKMFDQEIKTFGYRFEKPITTTTK